MIRSLRFTNALSAVLVSLLAGPGLGEVHGGQASGRPVIRIAQPIDQHDFERWRDQLTLGTAQMAASEMLFEDYETQISRWYQDTREALTKKSTQVGEFDLRSRERAEAYEDLMEAIVDADAELQERDEALFVRLGAILTDEQLEELYFVKLDCARIRLRSLFDAAAVPRARLDLIEMVEESDLTDQERHEVEPVLKAYLARIVPVVQHADAQLRKSLVKDQYLLVQPSNASGINAPRNNDMFEARMELWRRQLALWRQMAAVNDATWTTVMATIGEEHHEALASYRNQRCYPMVYDGPDAQRTFSLILDLSLEEEEREAVETLFNEYQTAYKSICRNLEGEVDRWKTQRALNGSFSAAESKSHNDKVRALKNDRNGLVHNSVRAALEIVPLQRIKDNE